ncbi:hypothetical protein PybrP1_004128 [[Pythium] brassicae (nom. inval.)]|nr:hypothetical protein PybrP1_004128 [[Pythium] brassicae (nom. inval.)]
MLRIVTKDGARAAARCLKLHGRCGVSSLALDARWSHAQRQQSASSSKSSRLTAIGALAAAGVVTLSFGAAQCEEKAAAAEQRSGYAVNPIQNVTALLRLYEEIDKNMEVLTNRMLADLKLRVEKEKEENDGKLKLAPQQLALNMSIAFESTLEKVQDAVFRNNYVTKAHVAEAMQQLVAGELRGGGADGRLTPAEAEAISSFVRRLGRMRWKVTGSRQPLLPTRHKALVKEDKPSVELAVVLQVMEELIPAMMLELEAIATALEASGASAAERRAQFSHEYVRRSGELTEQLCARSGVDLRAFQQALIFYHDDDAFEQALARLSAEQQKRIAELGL